jgi:periplasmic divalent cation tolerance protein
MEPLLVITNLPDQESAQRVAENLISRQLAACVNILAPCTSVYRWKGQVETAQEIPLLIKTLAIHYSKVEAAIRQQHPYELPEIIAVPLSAGLPEYFAWIKAETNNNEEQH